MQEVSAGASFRVGAANINTWILFILYGCSFGVELTMNNAASLYFQDPPFNLTTEKAGAIASIFGFMNLFARGLGGYASDIGNKKWGMKGRILALATTIMIEGAFVLTFAQTTQLGAAIVVLVFFSTTVQMAEGATYGIVPYVNRQATGSVSGIVGAGGNVGAVCFGMCFRQMDSYDAFMTMGGVILGAGLLTLFIRIEACSSVLFGGIDKKPIDVLNIPVFGNVDELKEPTFEIDDDDVDEELAATSPAEPASAEPDDELAEPADTAL